LGLALPDLRYLLRLPANFIHGKFTTPKSKQSRRVDLSRELWQVLPKLRDKWMLIDAFTLGYLEEVAPTILNGLPLAQIPT
jgi:hypothetical protein